MDLAWQESLNNVAADSTSVANNGKSFLWFLKEFLKGGTVLTPPTLGLWTVDYSCDSVTAGTAGDAVDRWTTFANIIRAVAGVAHSWMVLKSPTGLCGNGPYYCILDASGSSDTLFLNLIFSKTAPTGGTTTARPTASDEWTHAANQQVVEAVIAGWRFHAMLASTGEFLIMGSKNTSGLIWTSLGAFAMLERPSGFTPYRLATHVTYNASGSLFNAAFGAAAGWRGRKVDNSGNYASMTPVMPRVAATYAFSTIPVGGDFYGLDSPRQPVYVYTGDTGYIGVIGRLPDLKWGCTTQGPIVHPLGGEILLGDLWLPLTTVPSM